MQKLLKKSDKITKYLVAAILLVVPIYPKFPFIDIPNTHVFVRLEDFLMLFAGLYLFYFFAKDAKKFFKDKVNYSVLLFFFAGLISLASAIFVTKTIYPALGFLHWLRRVEYLIPLFLATTLFIDTKKKLRFYLNLIVLTLVIVFIYGFGQKYFSWPVIATQNKEIAGGIAQRWNPGSHLYSSFAGHYDLASYLVLMLPIIISYFYLLKNKMLKIVVGISFLCGLWLMANSLSRISIVSYLGGMTISLFLIKKYKEIIVVGLISLLVFGFSSNLLDRYSRIFQVTKEKIQKQVIIDNSIVYAQEEVSSLERRESSQQRPTPIPIFEDRSTSIRIKVEWPRALRALKKNPLLGTGYSSITLATDNDYLRLLGEVGAIGFLAFCLYFVRILSEGVKAFPLQKKFKNESLALMAGLSGAIPGVLLNALFIDIFEASKFAIVFWLMVGLGLSVVRDAKA